MERQDILRYARSISALRKRERKQLSISNLFIKGREEFAFFRNKPLFLVGLSLYWAEGDKNKNERVKFTNSDPKMIALMMRWFREICEVPEAKFRIALHIHDLHITENVRSFWSDITQIPEHQFQKIYIKHTSLRHRKNILYNGTCAIVVHDKNLFRRLCGWKAGLAEWFLPLSSNG